MKIAIVGSGISGLTCAHYLFREHEVHVFEASDRLGGHTHTVEVKAQSGTYAIDTGFIVFNDWTYPHFIKLLTELGVKWKDSSMSFSVKVQKNGLEYNGNSLNTLFAQRINLFRPSFHRMIQDILRFNRESVSVLQTDGKTSVAGETLAQYLERNHYSTEFKEHYIVPMGSAIWSASVKQMDQFPIEFFVRFFKNHGMLSVNDRPVWKVIEGGSRSYIQPLIKPFSERVHTQSPVLSVLRGEKEGVSLVIDDHGRSTEATFDHVILATHSDQSINMLKDASPLEREVLSCFEYQANDTVLHTDTSVLPKKKMAWAAWNYFLPEHERAKVAVTYNMNILQGIKSPESFNVSLNMTDSIDPRSVIKKMTYDHPVYTASAFAAQGRWAEVSGKNRVHFCGAYWGYGFHEDGVKSALKVCESFGVIP